MSQGVPRYSLECLDAYQSRRRDDEAAMKAAQPVQPPPSPPQRGKTLVPYNAAMRNKFLHLIGR